MNFEEFTETVLKTVCKKTEGRFDVSINVKLKNNGIKCTGISAMAEGNNYGPCVYLDGYYKEYENGNIKLHETADEVYRQIMECQDGLHGMNVMDFLHWENVRGRVYAKLVNAGRNEEMLGMVPHRLFLDLAVVYYIAAVEMDGGRDIGAVLISSRHMSLWAQSEEALYEAAVCNMRSDGDPLFENIGTVLNGLMPEDADFWGSRGVSMDIGMYVLTNHRKHYGASMMLDQNILKGISDRMKGDFIVLPSSVHEVIVLAADDGMKYRDLASIVQEVNAAEVSAEEYLSDHVYVYGKSDGLLKIAA